MNESVKPIGSNTYNVESKNDVHPCVGKASVSLAEQCRRGRLLYPRLFLLLHRQKRIVQFFYLEEISELQEHPIRIVGYTNVGGIVDKSPREEVGISAEQFDLLVDPPFDEQVHLVAEFRT